MPIRDDSAGPYGNWNDSDLSWIDWLGAKASDGGNALSNLGRNLVDGFSPVGTSEQGNMALQVPPVLSGIAQSYGRLAGTPSHPGSAYDLTGVPELDAPIQQDMSNVLLSLYGGNAVAGLAKPKPVSVQSFKGFHGSPIADGGTYAKSRGMYWGSSSPEVADDFALRTLFQEADRYSPSVEPAEFNFQNPLIVGDGAQTYWTSIPFEGGLSNTDYIASAAKKRGHDGVVFRNIDESFKGAGADTYVALKPGTVRSASTGETLFSDTGKPSILGSAMATGGDQKAANALSSRIFAIDDKIKKLSETGATKESWRIFGQSRSLEELRSERKALAEQWRNTDPTAIQVAKLHDLAKPNPNVWENTDWSSPIRAYHGTKSPYNDFAKIDQDAALNLGTHFGDLPAAEVLAGSSPLHGNPALADGASILPVDITMKNPLLIEDYVARIMEPKNPDFSDLNNLPGGRPTDVANVLMEHGIKFTDDELHILRQADMARPVVNSPNQSDLGVTSSKKYGINTPENRQANAIMREAINRAGHDGLAYGASDGVYGRAFVPTRRGSVRSATTGETLFSDHLPSPLGSALATGGDQDLPPWLRF